MSENDDRLIRLENKLDSIVDRLNALNTKYEIQLQIHRNKENNFKLGIGLISALNGILLLLLSLKII